MTTTIKAKRLFALPLRYKLIALTSVILLLGISVFSILLRNILIKDKKLFIMDMNSSLLSSAANSFDAAMTVRLQAEKELARRVADSLPEYFKKIDVQSYGSPLADEMLNLALIEVDGTGTPKITRNLNNPPLFSKLSTSESEVNKLNQIDLKGDAETNSIRLINQTLATPSHPTSVLTMVLPAEILSRKNGKAFVVVNLVQDFLISILGRSELAELFLVDAKGHLISHSKREEVLKYTQKEFQHPILGKNLNSPFVHGGTQTLLVNGEDYLVSVANSALKDLYVVAQIRSSLAYQSIRSIEYKGALILLLVAYSLITVCFFFSKRLSSNIEKLEAATKTIAAGDFNVNLDIHSRDEVESVAVQFKWMAERLQALMKETSLKARMEQELKTASIVQETLVHASLPSTDSISLYDYYTPASEIGGDFWDANLNGKTLTLLIGDATGHGAAGAIVMAVAKSCFNTLMTEGARLSPEEILTRLNAIINGSCQGKLLMTMFIIQLDLETGKLIYCNAGHEAAFLMRKNATEKNKKVEQLFVAGERLGFHPNSVYTSAETQIELGDTLMLYTDGLIESRVSNGNQWGERGLKKFCLAAYQNELKEVHDKLLQEVQTHFFAEHQEDDVTYVLLRWMQKAVISPSIPIKKAA